jgi:2-dehydro-3-deoxygalactonokinase
MASIYLDIGSTNSRGWLVERGSILEGARCATGVRDTVITGSTEAVRSAVRALISQLSRNASPERIVAAGMITSSIGLAEVPHVAAPAGVRDLAAAVGQLDAPELASAPIVLVPGVRTPSDDPLRSDVMRGEETLVLGLLACRSIGTSDTVINAGSHWKLVMLDGQGRIARSITSLGGETLHAVRSATVLGASLPADVGELPPAWLERGAAAAAEHGLLRAFFGVRLLALAACGSESERHAFFVGAAVGHDLEALARSGELRAPQRVLVTGHPAIAGAWAHLLASRGIPSEAATPDVVANATVAGLAAIEAALA